MFLIEGRARDLGDGFVVRRVLPAPRRRSVGPFVFFDELGPIEQPAGHGLDVRPHPHIGLATVTYLLAGEILHRDSLGNELVITPGAVNWMTAGRGIVHSERSPNVARARGQRVHGYQLWVALPTEHEETAPSFQHVAAHEVPEATREGARIRVIAGEAFGLRSPARVLSPLFYADLRLEPGASLSLDAALGERAVHVVEGELEVEGRRVAAGSMAALDPEERVITASSEARGLLLGGAPVGERHLYWNFVSSSVDRIERAKDDWRARRFPLVPGDELEFTPLPE